MDRAPVAQFHMCELLPVPLRQRFNIQHQQPYAELAEHLDEANILVSVDREHQLPAARNNSLSPLELAVHRNAKLARFVVEVLSPAGEIGIQHFVFAPCSAAASSA